MFDEAAKFSQIFIEKGSEKIEIIIGATNLFAMHAIMGNMASANGTLSSYIHQFIIFNSIAAFPF